MKKIITLAVAFFIFVTLDICYADDILTYFPKMSSDTYLFALNDKRLNKLKVIAIPVKEKDFENLKDLFEKNGFRVAVIPEDLIARTLETGMVDCSVSTSVGLVSELKNRIPAGVLINLFPKPTIYSKIQIDRKQNEAKSSVTAKKDSLPVSNRPPMEKSGHLNIQEKTKKTNIDKQVSGFETASGPNWEFRVLSVENTGKQRWESSGSKLNKVYHISINEENLSFWRVKAEVKRKKSGIDFDSQWVKLTYRVYKGKQSSVEAVANIINLMGKKVASKGNIKVSFGRRKLSEPLDLDLLFLAPKDSRDIKDMYLHLLNYAKVRVMSK
jgi:hypothetical protein